MNTKITKLFGIKYPVILSGMSWISTPELVAAVANAGGLGTPIINGLVNLNPSVTLQGALLAAGLALILDAYLGVVGRALARGQ